MYLILIKINNDYIILLNAVTCSHPLLFNFDHASGWEQLILAAHPTHCNYDGLWVNLHFFMMCIYKHCFPPMLLFVFAMECCTKNKCLAICLITIIAALALLLSPIYACLTCSSVHLHASSLHSLLAHHHLCYVDVYCVFLFLLYATTFLSDSIFMACLCTYFLFRFSF